MIILLGASIVGHKKGADVTKAVLCSDFENIRTSESEMKKSEQQNGSHTDLYSLYDSQTNLINDSRRGYSTINELLEITDS